MLSTTARPSSATASSTAIGRNDPPSHCTNQKKTAMHTRLQTMANATGNCGVVSSIRPEAAMVYVYAKVKALRTHLRRRSANTMAMMRGVNCALANCTTINSDDTTKTTKVSIDDVNAPKIVRA